MAPCLLQFNVLIPPIIPFYQKEEFFVSQVHILMSITPHVHTLTHNVYIAQNMQSSAHIPMDKRRTHTYKPTRQQQQDKY